MNFNELDSFKLSDAISFHDELNPNLWNGQELRPEVKEQLLYIAKDFLEELGVNDLDVVDITVSGSNAAYSYTPHSDLDLHILVDLSKLDNDEIYKELFNAKKTLYNDTHDISIHGVPVELYVQDAREPVVSLGEYSILHDEWLRIPTKRRANLDQTATKAKYEKLHRVITKTLQSKNILQVDKVLKKIRQYRQAGLDKGGEFGPENLAFKVLRKQGLIKKLYNLRDKLHSEKLTIDEDNPLLDKPTPTIRQVAQKHGVSFTDIMDQLVKGVNVELEHTNDEKVAREIALDHLGEDPEYYTKLASLELEEDSYTMNPGPYAAEKTAPVTPYGNKEREFRGSIAEDSVPQIVYHVTPTSNLKSIAKHGLTPTVGDRTSQIAGEKSGIYVFPDKVSAEDAVMNWLGDEFDDEPLTMLKIDVSGLEKNITKGADYELIVGTTIEPNRIKKVNIQLEEASGYIPSEKEKNDPRFKTALTVDVHPNTMKKDAKKFGNKISRAGIPPTLNPSGKF